MKIPGSTREEVKGASATRESTYKNVSEARESKMPGGSSVRSLPKRFLKAARNEFDHYSGLPKSHVSLVTTTRALTSTLHTRKLRCQMQQNWPSSSIEQRLYPAASRWAKANEEKENIRLEDGGSKRCLRNPRKCVQKCQRSQRVEDARWQLCQFIATEKSESNKK